MTQSAAPTAPAVRREARIRGLWWKALGGAWMVATMLAVFLYVGPADNFPDPEGARLIVFHVPNAWLSCLAYLVAAWCAAKYLIKGRADAELGARADRKCAAAMELGLLFSILTTVSGSIFSRLEWGKFWNWDPRQTSIVIIMLIFAAYVVLRGAIADPVSRARLSSAYALVAVVPGLFLIWVLPRIVWSLHGNANSAVVGGMIGGHYRVALYCFALPSFLLLFAWLLGLRVRAMRLEAVSEGAERL